MRPCDSTKRTVESEMKMMLAANKITLMGKKGGFSGLNLILGLDKGTGGLARIWWREGHAPGLEDVQVGNRAELQDDNWIVL
jgi:hypothetical protein